MFTNPAKLTKTAKTGRAAKALLSLAAATGIVAATAGAAQAQTLSQDGYYYYGSGAVADCTITGALDKATLFSWQVFGTSNVRCSQVHSTTTLTTYLKASDGYSSWTVSSAQTTFSNSYGTGSRWLSTGSFSCNPNLSYQTVASTSVSGVGSFYVTTGAPKKVC